ncbi:hypothetical protein [Lactococcus protaetiae]|uniref:Uncharacterized protein n=1 Tax=Lactococcus protaetiae TaxID=2592653 RepID=A0A514Z6C2_9LACT|nr:hypothetical protein [Lactococcus protaetiae]QDK70142.1 hypothetical protein FLP15_01810 [Lactococcus protaetiae]
MLELSDFKAQEKASERRMQEKYLRFDRRLREIEQELMLRPFAKVSEVMVWAENLKKYIGKIHLMQQESIQFSKEDWGKLVQSMMGYIREDNDSISIFSEYVLFLVYLEKRYKQRLYIFGNYLDNSVRYIKGYAEDMESQGFSLTGILAEVQSLNEMNWLSILDY